MGSANTGAGGRALDWRAMPTGSEPLTVFYDEGCGLCRRSAWFLARRDPRRRLAFAPIGGARFLEAFPEDLRGGLPDSLIVPAPDGRWLFRSDAVLAALREIGGGWGVLGRAAGLVPHPVRDAVYDGVARLRHRLSGGRACRPHPPELKDRFGR